MPDFPTTLYDFQRRFAADDACYEYVRDLRWPKGFKCPNCGARDAYDRPARKAVQCASCRTYASLTAGTVMHKSHIPLCKWLLAAWLVVSSKRGVSAVELKRQIGVSEETAFTMLHKLRHAMVDPEREPLRGLVEVDGTFVGGERRGGGSGRWKGAQEVVVGAIEVTGKRTPVRLRLRVVASDTRAAVMPFIRDVVEKGSTVRTDASAIYATLPAEGYRHQVDSVAHAMAPRDVLPTLHLAFSNLQTWLNGTFHGAVRREHLQAYLNEFVFRFNRRGNLAAAFNRLLGLAGEVGTLTYERLYGDRDPHPNPGRRRA